MKKAILISREGGETRACLLISGKLVNIDAEGPSGSSIIGNIYKGVITDIARSLNAAFVQIGEEREGFLSIQDIHPAILESHSRRPHMRELFSKGQEILVQVLRDPIGDKGPMLTTCISLPGRYVVLMPAAEKTGISKKLPDEERKRLRAIIGKVNIPDGFGVIVRTAGQNRKKAELTRDLNQLVKMWNNIESVYGKAEAPSLVVQEQSVAIRFLREYLTTDVTEIVVDDKQLHREVSRFLDTVMPRFKKVLKSYGDKLPLFVRYNVESQIEKMFLRDVPLPSGGSIVIDRTEALVAIDVNSGRQRGKNVEETAFKTNLEAAEEVASQLLLRDLGGLIVIDFIDMVDAKNRTRVQQQLREAMKRDKAKFTVGRISQFGLLEMTRQKLRSGVVSRATETCTRCRGVGYLRTTASSGLHILRRIRELAVGANTDIVRVTAPVSVANFMQNSLRNPLNQIETEHGVKVIIEGDPDVYTETIEQIQSDQEEKREQPAPVDAAYYESDVEAEDDSGDDAPSGAAPEAGQNKGGGGKNGQRSRRQRSGGRRPQRKPEREGEGEAAEAQKGRGQQSGSGQQRRKAAASSESRGQQSGSGQQRRKAAASSEPRRQQGQRGQRGQRGRKGQAEPTKPDPQNGADSQSGQGEQEVNRRYTPPGPPDRPRTTYPRPERPSWDSASGYGSQSQGQGQGQGKDGLIDRVIKKLLGLDR